MKHTLLAFIIALNIFFLLSCKNRGNSMKTNEIISDSLFELNSDENYIEPPPIPKNQSFKTFEDWLKFSCSSAHYSFPGTIYCFRLFKIYNDYAIYVVVAQKGKDRFATRDSALIGESYRLSSNEFDFSDVSHVLSKTKSELKRLFKTKQFDNCKIKTAEDILLSFGFTEPISLK